MGGTPYKDCEALAVGDNDDKDDPEVGLLCSGVFLLTSLEGRGWLTLKSCFGEVEFNRGCLFEGGLALLGPSSLSLRSNLDLFGDCLGDP